VRWRSLTVAAIAVSAALALVGNLATNTVEIRGGWLPWVLWTSVVLLVVASAALDFRRSDPGHAPLPLGTEESADELSQGVQGLWRREEDHRRVHDPAAMPVRWRAAASGLADDWANVCRLPTGAVAEPLALAGRVEEIAETYRRIPSGRLVILGAAGAGKTILAGRLTLDLLDARRPGQPVPVVVSVSSWNPVTTSIDAWLGRQLIRDHPGLRAAVRSGGPSRADALIGAHRILPVLDGFDEIHPALHQAALQQLNTVTRLPLVITSRPQEYAAAVAGADVLTAAAVIELADLTLDDLDVYLPRTATGKRTGLWDPVLSCMRHQPESPGAAVLRHVLSNPLMIFLARTVYSDTPHRDPAELLDTARFAGSDALEEHLLAAFVPAVYQHHRPGARRWVSDRARRYLAYLANHLDLAGTSDLAWWQLRDTIPRVQRVLVLTFALAVMGMVPFLVLAPGELRFAVGLAVGMAVVFPASMVFGRATGLTSVAMFGLDLSIDSRPEGTHLRSGVRASRLTIGRWLGLHDEGPPPERSHL